MSSFIERFAIVGTAGVLGLMAVLGIFGFASLLGVEPRGTLPNPPRREVEEEVAARDDPADRARAAVRQQATPTAAAAVAPPAGPTPPVTQPPADGPPRQVLSAVSGQARPGGAPGGPPGPAAPGPAATPAPAPPPVPPPPAPAPTAPPSTPTPPAPTPVPTPTPTPRPPECSGGEPQLDQHGRDIRFVYGSVVSFGGGVLVVDVAGTRLSLSITDGTEVRGRLGVATLVSGEGRRSNGEYVATLVEVVC